jgi:hypothetical protein
VGLKLSKMENNGTISQLQRKSISLSNSQPSMKTPTTASNNGNNASFVNHGLTLWTERGQECASSQQHSRPQESGEPLIRYSGLLLDLPAQGGIIGFLFLGCLCTTGFMM